MVEEDIFSSDRHCFWDYRKLAGGMHEYICDATPDNAELHDISVLYHL